MRKNSLTQTIDQAYAFADSNLVEVKSAVIGLCADIERYFKVAFDVNLNEEIEYESFRRITYVFPRFASLTIEQFNRFILLFTSIRGINAHLYLSKPVFIDEDLKEFVLNNFNCEYSIEKDRKLTLYGAAVILAMLAQKYMIWPFCTSFFRFEYFKEIERGDKMSSFQVGQQKVFNEICGRGKPLTHLAEPVSGVEFSYINDVLKRCLTLVFFDLEKLLLNVKSCRNYSISLSKMLIRTDLFSEDLIDKIIKLRNCWFHGTFIGDVITYNDEEFEFTLEFAVEVLKELKDLANANIERLGLIATDIEYFGQNFFNFYALRLVEVSYKILDNRVALEEKLEGRLDNMSFSFDRFDNIKPEVYEMFADLMDHDEARWSVGASKFTDKRPRKFDTANLRILKLHSENGFLVGKMKTERKDIVLVDVLINEEYKNLVNGLDLQELNGTKIKECSRYITVEKVEL